MRLSLCILMYANMSLRRVVVVGDGGIGKSTLIATLGKRPPPLPIPDERDNMYTSLDPLDIEVIYVCCVS